MCSDRAWVSLAPTHSVATFTVGCVEAVDFVVDPPPRGYGDEDDHRQDGENNPRPLPSALFTLSSHPGPHATRHARGGTRLAQAFSESSVEGLELSLARHGSYGSETGCQPPVKIAV